MKKAIFISVVSLVVALAAFLAVTSHKKKANKKIAKESLEILRDVEFGIENEVPVDMVAIDIKRIWTKLGEILGENYSEELIDQLFSQFCLGK